MRAAVMLAALLAGAQAAVEPTHLGVVLASGRIMPIAVRHGAEWTPADSSVRPAWKTASGIPRGKPANGNDFGGVAIAGPDHVAGVDRLDQTSADWKTIWPAVRERASIEEEQAVAKIDARHSRSVVDRRSTVPGEVHLQRARRRTERGTWYHFVAHKFYGTTDPVTDLIGIAVRDRRGTVTVAHLTAWAWLDNQIEPELLATIHSGDTMRWLMQSVFEDRHDYFLFDPVAGRTILRKSPHQP